MKSNQAASSKAFAYYPGCSLHGTAKEYDRSTRLVCQALGIDLKELEDWICCGASSAHSISHLLSLALPAYNLQLAENTGLPLAIPCAACFGRLKAAAHEMRDESSLKEINGIIEGDFRNSVDILPLLEILSNPERLAQIKTAVIKSLERLKIASYYGCLIVRPPEIVETGEDIENPQMLDNVVRAVGAEAVDWPFKTECCGAFSVLPKPDMMHQLSYRILKTAKVAGAECIVVACPMCQGNLDQRQREIEAKYHERLDLPILYFTQVIGLALGMTPKDLTLDKHLVSPYQLLKSKGLI